MIKKSLVILFLLLATRISYAGCQTGYIGWYVGTITKIKYIDKTDKCENKHYWKKIRIDLGWTTIRAYQANYYTVCQTQEGHWIECTDAMLKVGQRILFRVKQRLNSLQRGDLELVIYQ